MRKSFIRSSREIEDIKKACRISDLAFNFILKKIKIGISEKELAKILSKFLRKKSGGISFRTIVAFGKNSSEVHHKVTNQKLKLSDVIMLDFGAKVNGVCSDITRTVFFGKATDEQKKVYQTVLKAQEKALKYLKSSIMNQELCRGFDVDKIARDYIQKQGFPNIPHGLGHAIGRSVHQGPRLSPKSKFFLKPGMVFTIEPAIYLRNFGVRIEDDILIAEKGIETLSKSPKKLLLIEN
ncbi:MAG: hypothetical protein A2W22_02250 [Candidatus Levybacteria bacterium RBG_16_35_11]|nr:MAG: hypothetical protein A2W22_02250 [Candidatus Levybacteria bacterium RBG_16_35_11]